SGGDAFWGCSSLTSVTIPNSVTSIGGGAFIGCSSLQNITCLATTPPTLSDNPVFSLPNTATLTVPCGTFEVYNSSDWNIFFAGRIEEDCGGIEQAEETLLSFFPNPTKSEITFSQAIEKVEVIDLTGKAILTFSNAKTINIESLPAGVYYLRLTNNDKAIMRKVIKE
ncbi:MAG: T9SS type A sorting domain-containing protein, partial [Bacteroidales bacterium]|nr:T9SS type A sorting domain-containing protein [Bacteroidales bacterium]